MNQTIPQGLDPTAFLLTKAIKATETKGSSTPYTASGDNGTSTGAYQIQNTNWSPWAKQYLGDANAPKTEENQNKLAYMRVKDLLGQGYSQSQVASIWNSGSPDFQGKVGTNSMGTPFNVPHYVDQVKNNYISIQKQFQPTTDASSIAQPDATQTDTQPPDNRSLFRKIGDFFTSGTQAAGQLIGQSLAAPGNADLFASALSQWSNQSNLLQNKIKEITANGGDPSKLQMVLKEHLQSKPTIEEFTGDVINKTPEQVVGTLAQSGLEALSGGVLEGGVKTIASKELGLGAKVLQGAKLAAPYGAIGGAAGAMQNNGSLGDVVGGGAVGGIVGGALGGALGGAGALGGKVASALDQSGIVNKILPESEARIARMESAVKDAQNSVAESYQKALPLTPTQQLKEANLLNKTGDNVYTTLAKYNVNVGSEDAIKQLQTLSDHFANATEYAQKNEHGLFNVDEIKANAQNQINQNIPSETGRIAAKDKIDTEINALLKANKDSVFKGPNNENLIDSGLVERLRKTGNSWTNFNAADPEKIGKSTGYALSNAVRDQVDKQGTFPGYREANKEWAKVIHAQQVLQKISDSGKTFKVIGGLSGSIGRRILSGVIGLHTGGIGGAILGEMGSEYGAKVLSNPSLRTYFNRQLIARFGAGQKATPEAVSKLVQEIEDHINSQKDLLRLPAPQSIPLGPQQVESTVKAVPAKAVSIKNPQTGKYEIAYTSEAKNPKDNMNLQGGFIKGADASPVLKIHPDDKGEMRDFIAYVAGDYKPTPKQAHQLEIDASRIAERYNIKSFKTNKGLSGEFARILHDQGDNLSLGKITKNPLIAGALASGALVAGSKLLKKGGNSANQKAKDNHTK